MMSYHQLDQIRPKWAIYRWFVALGRPPCGPLVSGTPGLAYVRPLPVVCGACVLLVHGAMVADAAVGTHFGLGPDGP